MRKLFGDGQLKTAHSFESSVQKVDSCNRWADFDSKKNVIFKIANAQFRVDTIQAKPTLTNRNSVVSKS
jgi:hypothetical protein